MYSTYNWTEIKKYSKSCDVALEVLKVVILKPPIIPLKIQKIVRNLSFKDQYNWLDRPNIFFDAKASDMEKCVYLEVASRRNRAYYKDELPFYLVEDLFEIKKLQSNTLLKIDYENEKILFRY